jgi:hypothetical protein
MQTWISCTVGFEGIGWRMERKRDPRAIEMNQNFVKKNSRSRVSGRASAAIGGGEEAAVASNV